MTQRIDAILFDLGETLLDFGRVDLQKLFLRGTRAAYTFLRELGQPVPPLPQYHWMQRRAVRLSILKSRLTQREFNATHVIRKLATKLSQTLSDQQIEHMAWLWYQPLSAFGTIEPGALDMLAHLHDRGLKLGIISKSFIPGQALDRHLSAVGLLDLMPVRVYSCDTVSRKPSKAIFRTALERLGCDAANTLYVGDKFLADIWGANRMNMISVLKSPKPRRLYLTRPKHVIRSLLELPTVLDQYSTDA